MKIHYLPLALLVVLISVVVLFPLNAEAQNPQSVSILKWSPDGDLIAGGDDLGFLRIWDAKTGETILQFQAHRSIVTSLSWSADGTRLASVSPDEAVVRIWNTNNGQAISELQAERGYEGLSYVAWNPKRDLLVNVATVIDGGSSLRFWNAADESYELLPISYDVSAYDIAWSPDGTRLGVADSRGVYIFSNFTSAEMEPHVLAPFAPSIAWSPDSSKLATVDVMAGIIRILAVGTGEVLMTFQGPPRDLEHGIASIAWSPDGIQLASDGFDGSTQIWNSITGELVETILLSRGGGRGLMSWSPYGGRLALGSAPSGASAIARSNVSGVTTQNIADGAVQIVVPAPSLERLQAIADACNAPSTVERLLPTSEAAGQLSTFVSGVEALPQDTIPPACAADLMAVAEALQSQ